MYNSRFRVEGIPPDGVGTFQCAVCGEKAVRMFIKGQDGVPVCSSEICASQVQDVILPRRHQQRQDNWLRKHSWTNSLS
jgi:hypothetical protein